MDFMQMICIGSQVKILHRTATVLSESFKSDLSVFCMYVTFRTQGVQTNLSFCRAHESWHVFLSSFVGSIHFMGQLYSLAEV